MGNKLKLFIFFSMFFQLLEVSCDLNGAGNNSNNSNNKSTATILNSIEVTPSVVTIPLGFNMQFSATGYYSDGSTADLTLSVEWSSVNSAVVSVDSTGLASTISAGGPIDIVVTESSSGVTGTASVTISSAAIASISVTPLAASIALGLVQKFTAIGTFSDNTQFDISGATNWISSSPDIASVNSSGYAESLNMGTTSISAINGSITSNVVSLTVGPPIIISISILPVNKTLPLYDTQQFSVIGNLSNGNIEPVPGPSLTGTVIWNSSNSSSATIDVFGLATGSAPGVTTISASIGGFSENTILTVDSATHVSPALLNPSSGSYTSTQNINMSTLTSGAFIYFTVNGSVPTCSPGVPAGNTLYTGSVSVSADTIIKAIACKTGWYDSAVTTENYFISLSCGVNDVDADGILDGCDPCIDYDLDGYGIDGAGGCLGPDCNDLDWTINPGASEICLDWIDNNCNGEIDEPGCI